jgi:hypothetical protein
MAFFVFFEIFPLKMCLLLDCSALSELKSMKGIVHKRYKGGCQLSFFFFFFAQVVLGRGAKAALNANGVLSIPSSVPSRRCPPKSGGPSSGPAAAVAQVLHGQMRVPPHLPWSL